MLGEREEFVLVSRIVGLETPIKVRLKAFNVASVRVIGAAEPSEECSVNIVHRHLVWFNPNVGTEAVQNRAFQSPKCQRGRYGKPEGDLDTVVERGIFKVSFNIIGRPIGCTRLIWGKKQSFSFWS